MPRFSLTNKHNPCPICSDTQGKCRKTRDSVYLCMNARSSVVGFRYRKETSNRLWGVFIPDDKVKEGRYSLLESRENVPNISPSAPIRDVYYREIFNQLDLHPEDLANLVSRGIRPEDASAAFRSVARFQKLGFGISHVLPGLGIKGKSLTNSQPGFLCPIHDIDGYLVAFQIRLRDGGYRWLSSYHPDKYPNGARPALPNGELPLAIHRPRKGKPKRIALVEGTGPKPYILANKFLALVIGAAGGQWAASPQTLKYTLEKASVELGTKEIDFYPDAGAIANPHVLRAYRALFKLLKQWGYDIKVSWWGQATKFDYDADEIPDDTLIERITVARFESIVHNPQDLWKDIHDIFQKAKGRCLSPIQPNGFGITPTRSNHYDVIYYSPGNLPDPQLYQELGSPKVVYEKGQRLEIWEEAVAKGWKIILDSSAPGLGKSHSAGVAIPDRFGVKKLFFFDTNHRNPTTATVEANYTDLPVRNNGFVRDRERTTPLGNDTLRWPREGEEPDTDGNCHRTPLFAALRQKNVEGIEASGESEVCLNCHLRSACQGSSGAGFGFRRDRRGALSQSRLRAHPDSAPNPVEFDFKETGQIWEEGGRLFKPMKSVTVGIAEFTKTLNSISAEHLQLLAPLIEALLPLMQGEVKEPYHGLDHQAIVSLLPTPPANIAEIILKLQFAVQPDLEFLNKLAEYGVDFQDLPQSIKRKFRADLGEITQLIKEEVPVNWILPLLRVWSGEAGAFRFAHGRLTIYNRDLRHANIARAAKFNIILDATVSRQYIALCLDADSPILEVQQETPQHENLTINQVVGLGKLGKERSETMQRRVTALRQGLSDKHANIAFGDWKDQSQTGDGIWFSNLRGSNEFQSCSALATFGIPYTNVGHLQALWQTLTGNCVSLDKENPDPQFQAFMEGFIQAEIIQAIGRLRSHLRPDEQLNYYFIADYDLSFLGLPVNQLEPGDISLEACGTQEANLIAVFRGLQIAATNGIKATQTAIGDAIGFSQGQISKICSSVGGLSRLKEIFQTLTEPYIAVGIFSSEEENYLAREFLKMVLEDTPEQLIEEVASVLKSVGKEAGDRILALLPISIRTTLIQQLSVLLANFTPK